MKMWHKILLLVVLLTIFGYLAVKFSSNFKIATAPHLTTTTASVIPTITPAQPTTGTGICHIVNGNLPDPSCTPGAIDPKVTQDNLNQTICAKGYTKTVRPPVSYTNKLKAQQIKDYGYSDRNLKNYEEDHLISLELGGNPTDPKNLWPEPGASPNQKDKIENLCNEKVCSGQITLAKAQQEIATNWTTACQ
jgi:hypothetical protein